MFLRFYDIFFRFLAFFHEKALDFDIQGFKREVFSIDFFKF